MNLLTKLFNFYLYAHVGLISTP